MYAVVNRLTFARPVDQQVVDLFAEEGIPRMREAGCLDARVVRGAPEQIVLVILFESAEQCDDVTARVGSPWMRERIVPLLAGPTERLTGPVVAAMGS